MLRPLVTACVAVLVLQATVERSHDREARKARVAALASALAAMPAEGRGATAHVSLNGAVLTLGPRCERADLEEPACVDGETKLDLDAMFPETGDAPGDDLPGVPRPVSSRRTFAATVLETGHSVRIYEAERESIDAQMSGAGFRLAVPGDVRLYVRGLDRVLVTVEAGAPAPAPMVRVTLARVGLL